MWYMFPVSILTFSIKGTICDRCFLCPSLYLNYWHNVIDGTHPMSILTSESLARRGRCILCPSLLLNHWHNVLDLHYVHPYFWIIGTAWKMYPMSILISESLAQRNLCWYRCPLLFYAMLKQDLSAIIIKIFNTLRILIQTQSVPCIQGLPKNMEIQCGIWYRLCYELAL